MDTICERKMLFLSKIFKFGEALFNKSAAMATPPATVNWKPFQMMPYIIMLKVRQFHLPTTSRLGGGAWIGLRDSPNTPPTLKF